MSMGETTIEIPVPVLLDGEPVESQTRATSAGAYTLILDTVLPEHGIHVHSIYTGHHHVPTSHAVHLMLAPGLREGVHAEQNRGMLPVTHARRRCLYDHLARLQDFLADLEHQVSIPLDEQAILAVET